MQRLSLVGLGSRPAWHIALFTLCAALWPALNPARVHAEELTSRGNLVFSAERLFGVYFDHESVELPTGRDDEADWTVFSLGLSGMSGELTTPRLGIDYFLTNNFTLGGNIGFASGTINDLSSTTILFAFRAGYALRLGHTVTLWPRGGFTYATTSVENNNADNYTFALTLDVPFFFALTEGFAITLGPNLDLGFLAERRDLDATQTVFGVMLGLAGWTNL